MVTGGSAVVAAGAEGVTPGADTTTLPQRRGENRRSNKPIMEKRRRARINSCLNELKSLILDAMKKDPARHSKLEKADILEMTVKHLETMQRQQVAMNAATDPAVVNKFRAGFNECTSEVGRFPGLETPVRRRLLQHLTNCLNNAPGGAAAASQEIEGLPVQSAQAVQVHILPSTAETQTSSQGIFFSSSGGGLQLVPTRLPNGDIALVLPSSGGQVFRQVPSSPSSSPAPSSVSSTSPSPLPMLIPIPSRTSSNASSTSPVQFERLTVNTTSVQSSPEYSSPTSPSDSYEISSSPSPRPYSPEMQKPLALVMRKKYDEPMEEEEKPWRPW